MTLWVNHLFSIHCLFLLTGIFFFLKTVKAKILFKTDASKSFTLDHCWGIFNQSPKWMKHVAKANAPAKSKAKEKKQDVPSDISSSANPASNTPSSNVVDSGPSPESQNRPKGSKAAKKKERTMTSASKISSKAKTSCWKYRARNKNRWTHLPTTWSWAKTWVVWMKRLLLTSKQREKKPLLA